MSDIKIVVACHKPTELPNNDIYYPLQVGADISSINLKIPGDNTGENISKKNETYCELTAQYWAWKNLNADYYGLCHYRRYLNLTDNDYLNANERNQVEVNVLNDYSLNKFGIENEEASRTFIEKYDVIVGKQQDVSKLFTPYGHKKTAIDHWLAHDRYLINSNDLEKMLMILDEKYPEIGTVTRQYLKGGHFLGFNCFVMKKQFFFEMCQMEFDVLNTLENYVNRTNYHQQLNRVYGFMGEILFSGYIAYLEKKKLARIKNVQMIYFNETDPVEQFYPKPINKHAIPVLYRQGADTTPAMLAVCLKSLIDSMSSEHEYDLLVLHRKDFTQYYKKKFEFILNNHSNIHVRWLRQEYYAGEERDRNIHFNAIDLEFPWILKNYEDAVIISDNMLVKRDVFDLYEEKLENEECIAAPLDILNLGKVNDGDISFSRHLINDIGMKDPYQYYSMAICKINLDKIRNLFRRDDLIKKYKALVNKNIYQSDILNVTFEGKIKSISLNWSYIPTTSDYLAYILPQMPYIIYQVYKKITLEKAYAVRILPRELYGEKGMENTTAELLIQISKELGVNEIIVHQLINGEYLPRISNRLDALFPANSLQTSLAYKVFPVGTPRYEKMRNILVKKKLIR